MENFQLNQFFDDVELVSVKERRNGKIDFEGENKKQILVICQAEAGGISPDERAFLEKILASVKLSLNDAAFLVAKDSPFFYQLKTGIHFKKLILFGVAPSQLGLNIACEEYTPVTFQDTEILACENLVRIGGSESSKASLWSALKKMFAV